jgi:hypothetical protein
MKRAVPATTAAILSISMIVQSVTHVWPSDNNEDDTANNPGAYIHCVDGVIR